MSNHFEFVSIKSVRAPGSESMLKDAPFHDTVSWADFIADATVHTDYTKKAENLTYHRLGYLPRKEVLISFMPFLRAALHDFEHNLIDVFRLDEEATIIVKAVRNKDMAQNLQLEYLKEVYDLYDKRRTQPVAKFVTQRLNNFLGYNPDLTYSVTTELWMQDIVAGGKFDFGDQLNIIDCKAITIIKYREVLLHEGKYAADNSELWFSRFKYGDGP